MKLSGSKFKTKASTSNTYIVPLQNLLHRILWMIKAHMDFKAIRKTNGRKKSIKGYKTQDIISVSGSLWNADCWKLGKYTGKALPCTCLLQISLDICCWSLAEIGWAGTTAAWCFRSQCQGQNTRFWGPRIHISLSYFHLRFKPVWALPRPKHLLL